MAAAPGPSTEPMFRNLLPGDPAPWFRQRSTSNPDYAFDTAAGRYIVMCFVGTANDHQGKAAIAAVLANRVTSAVAFWSAWQAGLNKLQSSSTTPAYIRST